MFSATLRYFYTAIKSIHTEICLPASINTIIMNTGTPNMNIFTAMAMITDISIRRVRKTPPALIYTMTAIIRTNMKLCLNFITSIMKNMIMTTI